jgi:hypothetical protein
VSTDKVGNDRHVIRRGTVRRTRQRSVEVHFVTIDGAFDEFQRSVNADPDQVFLARERRDTFKKAFGAESDVVEVFGSGSLARSTQLAPVHDVDLIVVYQQSDHPSWGLPGVSAEEALRHVQASAIDLLGTSGSVDQLVRETRAAGRDRAVKCFIDPPAAADAFTVDVMPALRSETGNLLLPSVRNSHWTEADPQYLIEKVADLQRQWPHFRGVVRMLKKWRLDQSPRIKSLVMEVLALKCLPVDKARGPALRDFFSAAAVEVFYGVYDPAGYCGQIQPDLDVSAVADALSEAHNHARLACSAAESGDTNTAKSWWREVFGEEFPGPDTRSAPAKTAPAVAAPRPVRDAPQG